MNTPRNITSFIAALIIATLCSSYAYGVEWNKIILAYDSFLRNPSDTTANQLLEVLPTKLSLTDRGQDEWGNTLEYIFDDNRVSKLERLINSGDKNVFNVLFKLKMITDGHYAEWVNIVLGTAITKHTELFLESLNRNIAFVPRLDSLLGNLGPAYVDRPKEQLIELEARYEAISDIKRTDLTSIRSECLDLLGSHIDEVKRWLKEAQ